MAKDNLEVETPAAEQTLEQIIDTADEWRAASLAQLSTVRQTKMAQWKREHARLGDLLGKDHPMVANLGQRMEKNAQTLRVLDNVTEQAKTNVPRPGKNAWAVHGYVRTPAGKSRAGLSVALYDSSGKWLREFGYAHTNNSGYFLLQPKPRQTAEAEKQEFNLRVLDANGATLYVDAEPLAPEPGNSYYREIVVGNEPVGEPPVEEGRPPGAKSKPKR